MNGMRWSVHQGLCGSCQRRLHRALPSNQPVGPPCPINEDREDRHLDVVLFRSMRVGKSDCDQFTINCQMTAYAPMGAIGCHVRQWPLLRSNLVHTSNPTGIRIHSLPAKSRNCTDVRPCNNPVANRQRAAMQEVSGPPIFARCKRHSRRTPR